MAGLVVFLGTVTQSPARFVYDAAVYWAGSVSLAHGVSPATGTLGLRGALTSLLYVPSALATRFLGDAAGGVAVLVENSLLVALVGVLLLPRLLGIWGPVTSWMVWVSAGLTWLLVGRFAPYPLVDLWAAALMLAAVVLLKRLTAIGLMGAGLLAGIAFNVRPAYLVPLVLALALVLLRQRLAGLWFAVGVVLALVPQSMVNLSRGTGWKPWPPNMASVAQLQSFYASYSVRYDTVYPTAGAPRQFFCSPDMAQAVGSQPPLSTGGLAAFFLHTLPQSLVFVAEKMAAVLHWPLSTPYLAPTGAGDQMFALLVTTVSVLGVVALVHAQFTSGFRSAPVAAWVALAVWIGSLATVVTSTPETRYAMPLVLLGIAGCATVVRGKLGSRWVAGAFMAVALVFAIGTEGLSHPAPPGPVFPATCAAR
ncbi:MAG: hypothetical protein IMZ75_10020 [Actinobacteria bacterium]|nr:hypothetical protein [Actinomycetota bacterium]